jgi:hypothetical protein
LTDTGQPRAFSSVWSREHTCRPSSVSLLRRSEEILHFRLGRGTSAAVVFLLFWLSAPVTKAQSAVVNMRILPASPPRINVEGERAPTRSWSFRKSYARVMDLGQRIEKFRLSDTTGRDIPVRQLAPGEFEAAAPASKFSYEIVLTPPTSASDAAFVSWLGLDRGLLMLGDLLPVFTGESSSLRAGSSQSLNRGAGPPQTIASLKFTLPQNWTVYSTELRNSNGEFNVAEIANAVFVVGRDLRMSRKQIRSMDFNLISSGSWAFKDDDALELAGAILRAHAEVLGALPNDRAALVIMPFPGDATSDKWSAETRGSTVSLLLGKQPSKTAALAQLSVPLTHELFHLWVPNDLALDGDYGWFYEGFTIYQAARTAVRLQLLTFQEFLDGIGRAYDAYMSSADRDRWSLVDASQQRWAGGETSVYQKAMLVAFLYDLRLRVQSGGKHSLDDVYRELFRQHRLSSESAMTSKEPHRSIQGNEATISILSHAAGMQSFASSFVQRVVAINLESELAQFGLRVERVGMRSRVAVNEQLNKQQRDLLRELGYNGEKRPSDRTRSRKK